MHSYDSTHPLIQAYTKHCLLVRCDNKVKTLGQFKAWWKSTVLSIACHPALRRATGAFDTSYMHCLSDMLGLSDMCRTYVPGSSMIM